MNSRPFNLQSLSVCKELQLESLLNYKEASASDADKLLIEQHLEGCDLCSKTLIDMDHFFNGHTTDLLDEEWEQNRSKMSRKLTWTNYKVSAKESFSQTTQLTLAKVQKWSNNITQILVKPQFLALTTCFIMMVYGLPLLTEDKAPVLASSEYIYLPPYVDRDNEAIYPDELAYYNLKNKYEDMAYGSLRYVRTKY